MKKQILTLIFLFLAVCGFTITINVPADYETIQAGLNVATEGDSVLVANGIYYENIVWPVVNGIKLIGESEETTIIDGDSLASVIRFEEDLSGTIDSNTIITRFTIQNGYAYGDYDTTSRGGGIYCYQSSPSLEDITISENYATVKGGGIYCYQSSPSLEHVTITNNSATSSGGGIHCYQSNLSLMNVRIANNSAEEYDGGGMLLYESSASLENVIITNNFAYYGGGISCWNSSSILDNVTISENEAVYIGGGICSEYSETSLTNVTITHNWVEEKGGGIFCRGSMNITLLNVTITNNWAGYRGGGVYIESAWNYTHNSMNVVINQNEAQYGGGIFCSSSSPNLVDVTITNNSAQYGGGISMIYDSHPRLINCIMWNNSPREIYFFPYFASNSILIAYSDIQGGLAGIQTNNNGTVYWEEGNINENPLFVNAENGDYTLQQNSPCIDAGIAYFEWDEEVWVDLAEDEYYGIAPDMGCYEWEEVNTEEPELPVSHNYQLSNHPNPFNPTTTISFSLT
ncbi:MAG: hypothetical protein HN952_04030, partial [Candidatus Cloacimonetes bacterium]|nr:hypothetical protein [Candidatus Cloacimonadota bacterium]